MAEMELPEVRELEEHARESESRKIGLMISVLAILLAICSAFGRKSETFEIAARVNASNTWAHYQAKRQRGYQSETISDVIRLIANGGSSAQKTMGGKLLANYEEKLKHYDEDSKKTSEEAKSYAENAERWEARANRFGLSEIFLQIGVVLCSVAILARARTFVYGGLTFAAIGIAVALSVLAIQ